MTGSASFSALGSTAFVAVSDPGCLESAVAVVRGQVEQLDLACSRFRDDSELARVNRSRGRAVQVGPLLLEAIGAALRAAELTDGDVDPTVGGALVALGYDRDFDSIGVAPRVAFREVPGWRSVEVDADRRTVYVPSGVMLDLGATAKALGADQAAAHAHAAVGCGVLVGLGGDFATAGEAPASGWRVRVTDDHRAGTGAPGQWIRLHGGGLATSSTVARRWQAAAESVHHLIDPASGRSAGGPWRTASVAASSCLDANIASTAAIIRGDRAQAWLESLALPARLVSADEHVRHLAGWPAAGDDLVSAPVRAQVSAVLV
jgi:FAD:protein FMN transferase